MTKPQLAFVGAGTLGTVLARAASSAGYPIRAIFSRNREDAVRLANAVSGSCATPDMQDVAGADMIFLTVPDDEIAGVCDSVDWRSESCVVHCSGALSLDVLASASERGAKTGSLHPLQTFAGRSDPAQLADIAFAVEASDGAIRRVLEELVRDLGGRPQWIQGKDKPLYHASAAMASNYLVALLGDAAKLWESFGMSRKQGMHSLLPLVRGTIDNLQDLGFPDALTGPIARGDVETVRIHLKAFAQSQPDIIPSYIAMGRRAVVLGLEKGTLTKAAAAALQQLFDHPGEGDMDS